MLCIINACADIFQCLWISGIKSLFLLLTWNKNYKAYVQSIVNTSEIFSFQIFLIINMTWAMAAVSISLYSISFLFSFDGNINAKICLYVIISIYRAQRIYILPNIILSLSLSLFLALFSTLYFKYKWK